VANPLAAWETFLTSFVRHFLRYWWREAPPSEYPFGGPFEHFMTSCY